MCVELADDHFGLSLALIGPLLAKMWAENDFHSFVSGDLYLSPLDLKLSPIVTLVQRCVHTKLEVSVAFCFKKIVRMGRTDREGAKHNVAP